MRPNVARPPTESMPTAPSLLSTLRLRHLGTRNYTDCWQDMKVFTEQRQPQDPDELWLLQHPPVYTLGLNGDATHLLHADSAPLVHTDRGGQITWHGPGQLVAYTLLDIRRKNLGVRALVTRLESAVIDLLAAFGLPAAARQDAPGVYVEGRKIASIGLRVRKGCTYHGISLNVDPDLSAFDRINPCGYPGLIVSSLQQEGIPVHADEVMPGLATAIMNQLAYEACIGQ